MYVATMCSLLCLVVNFTWKGINCKEYHSSLRKQEVEVTRGPIFFRKTITSTEVRRRNKEALPDNTDAPTSTTTWRAISLFSKSKLTPRIPKHASTLYNLRSGALRKAKRTRTLQRKIKKIVPPDEIFFVAALTLRSVAPGP